MKMKQLPSLMQVTFILLTLWTLSFIRRSHSVCIENLPNRTIDELANFALDRNAVGRLTTQEQRQYIFPSLNFTCSGKVFMWRIASPDISNGGGRAELSVWRESSPGTYQKHAGQLLDECKVKVKSDNTTVVAVHENFLNSSDLPFEAGDILGLYTRREQIFRFNPYFQETEQVVRSYSIGRNAPIATTGTFTITDGNLESVLPLLSVEICVNDASYSDEGYPLCDDLAKFSVRTVEECSTDTVEPSSTVSPPAASSDDEVFSMDTLIIIIVGGAAGVVLLLVVATIIVVCCMCRRRSWKPEKHRDMPISVNTGTPLVSIIPTDNGSHMYDRPGLPFTTETPPTARKDSFVVSVPNDLYSHATVDGAKESAAFDYEQPIVSLSQMGNDTLLSNSYRDRYMSQSGHPVPYTPTLPVPGAFNFPIRSDSASPQGWGSPQYAPGSPAFYHTLESPSPSQFRSRTRVGDTNLLNPHYRARSRSIDELDSRPTPGSRSSNHIKATVKQSRSIDELSRPHFVPPREPQPAVGLSQVPPGSEDEEDEQNYATIGPRKRVYMSLETEIFVPTQEQRTDVASSMDAPIFDDNIYTCFRDREAKDPTSPLGPHPTFFEESEIYWRPASNTSGLYAQLSSKKYREIYRKRIEVTDHLGSGEFGTVCKGTWQSKRGKRDVAVKMLNSHADANEKVRFLQEAAIMGQFSHPNIVRLYGVVTVGDPLMIVLEVMKHGDLKKHLRGLRPVPGELVSSHLPQKLLEFCSQIALGTEYLARKEFIHRDLAARNVLLTEENVCKIADFGMSRDLEDDNYYIAHGGKIPIKWTALEAISYRKYSTASDVWSFGCVMYEIWSLGHSPFKHQSPEETIQLVEDGHRLAPPTGCPRSIYSLMIDCWHPEAIKRPTATKVVQTLSRADLKWSPDDTKHNPQASALGAPMELGESMFPDLHKKYLPQE